MRSKIPKLAVSKDSADNGKLHGTSFKQPRNLLPSRASCHGFITWRGISGLFITLMTDEERKENRKEYQRNYQKANREKLKEYQRNYQEANREKAKEYSIKYYEDNRQKVIQDTAKWRAANLEKANEHSRKYYGKNREKMIQDTAKWQAANPEKSKDYSRKYYEANREKIIQGVVNRRAKKRKEGDPVCLMAGRVRARMHMALRQRGLSKESKTQKMLGCSFKQFNKHIESQFTDGMSWDNRSEWHLDHILPLSCATTIEGLEKLSHYTNIRPLWAAENRRKSDNLVLIP